MSSVQVAIGIDLGGTKTAFGTVGRDGAVLDRHEIPTLARVGGEALARETAAGALVLVERARARGEEVVGVGIGSAGVIGSAGEVVSAADVIKDWAGTPLGSIVSEVTGLPVRAVNDVHAHGLGEAVAGAARAVKSSVMVAFGTGVGGCYIEDGVPMVGAHFLAGHVGHFSSPLAVGLDCSCGGTAHVEAIAAGPAIHRLYLRLGGDKTSPDTRDVAARAAAGEELACEAINIAARAAGVALGDLANILDPEMIVVSGGVPNIGERWWQVAREAYAESALGQAKETLLVAAELGADAPLVGAVSLLPDFLTL